MVSRDFGQVFVMAGLDPAIHAFAADQQVKTWMPGASPGMTAPASAVEQLP
jgi:hypothetical protein